MTVSTDMQLDELLAACRQDRLIDAFEWGDHEVVISLGYARHRLSPEMAIRFLQGVMRYAPDLHTIEALFAHAAQVRLPLQGAASARRVAAPAP